MERGHSPDGRATYLLFRHPSQVETRDWDFFVREARLPDPDLVDVCMDSSHGGAIIERGGGRDQPVDVARRTLRGRILLMSLSAVACGGAEADGDAAPTDPSDVASGPVVEITSEALLQIGDDETDPRDDFALIVGAGRTTSGNVWVADRRLTSVRVFDADGTPTEHSVGRGGGPAELSTVTAATGYRGDSILVFDGSGRRLIILSGDGAVGRAAPVRLPPVQVFGTGEQGLTRSPELVGPLADGSVVFTGAISIRGVDGADVDWSTPFVHMDALGDSLRPIGSIDQPPFPIRSGLGPGGAPFRPGLHSATGRDQVYVALGWRPEIMTLGAGGVIHTVGSGSAPVLIPAEAEERYREEQRSFLSSRGLTPPDIERNLAQLRFPANYPYVSDVLVDAEGWIWLREYGHEDVDPTWLVFGADLRPLGRATTPRGLEIHEIGAAHVVGTAVTDTGLPVVRVHGLRRHAGELRR